MDTGWEPGGGRAAETAGARAWRWKGWGRWGVPGGQQGEPGAPGSTKRSRPARGVSGSNLFRETSSRFPGTRAPVGQGKWCPSQGSGLLVATGRTRVWGPESPARPPIHPCSPTSSCWAPGPVLELDANLPGSALPATPGPGLVGPPCGPGSHLSVPSRPSPSHTCAASASPQAHLPDHLLSAALLGLPSPWSPALPALSPIPPRPTCPGLCLVAPPPHGADIY